MIQLSQLDSLQKKKKNADATNVAGEKNHVVYFFSFFFILLKFIKNEKSSAAYLLFSQIFKRPYS